MRFVTIASDYDGTLACNGQVSPAALDAIHLWRATQGKVILVTGRLLEDLRSVFSAWEVFDRIVAENGALLYRPGRAEEELLCEEVPSALVACLRRKGVAPIWVGKGIIAAKNPYGPVIGEALQELQLDWHIVRNRESLMAMPKHVDKGSGLRVALGELGLAPANVLAIGDAENDIDFFKVCGASAAVADASPELQAHATFTTHGACGSGFIEAVHFLLAQPHPQPLSSLSPPLAFF